MKRSALLLAFVVLLGTIPIAESVGKVPRDFYLLAESGPRMPSRPVLRVEIDGTSGTYWVVEPEDRATGTGTVQGTFTLLFTDLQCLFDEVQASGFLTAKQPAEGALDGTYARLTVTADGTTSTIETRNTTFSPVDLVILRLNSLTPGDARLRYNEIAGATEPPACR